MIARLVPLLPPHTTYCEPFAGGAAVFWAKAPAPVEVLNDVDQALVNFYRVLRNPAMFAEFVRLVALTPYSRAEWDACKATWREMTDPIEQAYRWFIWARQCFGGGGQQWGGWQTVVTETARGMASNVANWLSAVEGLPAVHARLQRVQLECLDWRRCIALYDTPDTLIYADPPYMQETRGRHRYQYELTAADHADLVTMLLGVQGKVVLSGYAHPIYTPLEAAGWQRIDWATNAGTVIGRGAARVESVWLSPSCAATGQQVMPL